MISDERFADMLELALSAIKEVHEVTQADFVLTADNPHRPNP